MTQSIVLRAMILLICVSLVSGGFRAGDRSLRKLQQGDKARDTAEQDLLTRARSLHRGIITIDSHTGLIANSARPCGASDAQVDYLGLVHEGHNDLADSSDPNEELGDASSEHGGVSKLGERVIAEMNRLGIVVDVSHMSKAARLDAIRLSRAPVIDSHSSMLALVPDRRNMDDETLRARWSRRAVWFRSPRCHCS